ncbi:MAG TPA: HD-GYP domain-containing protein [Chloroflexota bacterium]|nr:HD-GYP domain-containing protein [Chloroflexota bacterium]
MHRAATPTLTPGLALAKTIYTEKGDILLARGVVLTPRYIKALEDRGYYSVYVMDGIADDIEPLGLISDQLRASAVNNVRSIFALISHATQGVRDQAATDGAHALVETPLRMGADVERELNGMVSLAEAILDEVLDQDSIAGMASLKAHDTYTFEHSVEVAVYGVMLGKRIGLARALLKDVALGCLLHDIGKQYVDQRILNKPGKLDPDEFEQIMQHPLLGYQLVRQMPIESPRPAHIVFQHHERQDGAGYPNRLFGTNRLARTDQERFDPRRISLMAEVAAIADVYSALASDRPYRSALPADQIFSIMRQESGEHLNRDLLRSFVTFVQHFPVGSHVRVLGGVYSNCVGVVFQVSPGAPARPFVRLMFDGTGRSLGAGRDIDMRQQPSTTELQILPDTSTLETASHPKAPMVRAS